MEKSAVENKSGVETFKVLLESNYLPSDFTEDPAPINDRLCPTPLAA